MIQGRPPPPKMAIFCPKMALKCRFWAENSGFWGRVVNLTPPHPISQVLHSNKHVFQGWEPEKWLFQGRPPGKKGHFLPGNGLKMPILGQKQCSLGSGGQFDAPPPYFAGARLIKKHVLQG